VTLACVFTGREKVLAADAVLPVTARLPEEVLLHELRVLDLAGAGIESVVAIGDALAPATIAHATYAGRRYAEELDAPPLPPGALPFKREITELLKNS
jgi:dimethylamine/trimethylamine dehydrogenase